MFRTLMDMCISAWHVSHVQLQLTHISLTVTQVCVVAAAVIVVFALGVAVALVLRVVLLTTPALAGHST